MECRVAIFAGQLLNQSMDRTAGALRRPCKVTASYARSASRQLAILLNLQGDTVSGATREDEMCNAYMMVYSEMPYYIVCGNERAMVRATESAFLLLSAPSVCYVQSPLLPRA